VARVAVARVLQAREQVRMAPQTRAAVVAAAKLLRPQVAPAP